MSARASGKKAKASTNDKAKAERAKAKKAKARGALRKART
jgi:hypothetical protein